MPEEIIFIPKFNIYCEVITKLGYNKGNIIMIPGGAHTGACYKVTPDNRKGWAYFFAQRGYKVFVCDWPGVGRSGYVSPEKLNGDFVIQGITQLIKMVGGRVILFTHSMSGAYGWKCVERAGKLINKVVAIAPAPMGNIQLSPLIIEKNEKYIDVDSGLAKYRVDLLNDYVSNMNFIHKKLIGKSKLFPRKFINNYIASLVPIPRNLLYERLNINNSQIKLIKFNNFKKIKIFVITGTNDTEHHKNVDYKIVEFLKNKGSSIKYCYLGDLGIKGNGHMLMIEKNNIDIARVILKNIS